MVTKVFKVSREKVWAAITEKERMKEWYFDIPDFELEKGKEFNFYGGEFLHTCTVVEVVPLRTFHHTWTYPLHSKGTSLVRWELQVVGPEETRLSLRHTGVESFSDGGNAFLPENYQRGWNAIVHVALRNYLYGIRKLTFEEQLPAPTARVWDVLWGQYGSWCLPFGQGMHWTGKLKMGERVHLLDSHGEGYYSDITAMTEGKQITFTHVGMVKNGKEQPIDEESVQWTGCTESFTLTEVPEGTKIRVEVDTTADAVEHMERVYPLALKELKTLLI